MNAYVPNSAAQQECAIKRQQALINKARQDLIGFLGGTKTANIGPWAYMNGGFKIFSNYQEGNPDCSYYYGEKKLFTKHKAAIADTINDTNTAVIIGAGKAFDIKEEQVLSQLKNLRQVVLIDVSSSGNDHASNKLRTFKEKHKLDFEIVRIDRDLFELTPEEIASCQIGVTTVIATGGMPFNSPGAITDAKPDLKLKEVFAQVGKILSHGEQAKNAFLLTHKTPPTTPADIEAKKAEYKYSNSEKPYANVSHWLTNCLAYMLKTADVLDQNPDFEDFEPHTLADYFRHDVSYEQRAENLRNGLEVTEGFKLNIPLEDGTMWSRSFSSHEFFCFFNTVFATSEWLKRVASTTNNGTPYSANVVSINEGDNTASVFRPEPPKLAA